MRSSCRRISNSSSGLFRHPSTSFSSSSKLHGRAPLRPPLSSSGCQPILNLNIKLASPKTHHRLFSTSQPSPISIADFFRAPPTPTQARQAKLLEAHREWLHALDQRNPNTIKSTYTTLQKWVEENRRHHIADNAGRRSPSKARKTPSDPGGAAAEPIYKALSPNQEHIQQAMEILSFSATSQADVELIKAMHQAVKPSLREQDDVRYYEPIIRSMLAASLPHEEAVTWLENMLETSPAVELPPEAWGRILSSFSSAQDVGLLKRSWSLLKNRLACDGSAVPLASEHYTAYLKGLFAISTVSTRDIRGVLKEMDRDGVEKDVAIHTILLEGYSKLGATEHMTEAAHEAETWSSSNPVTPSDPSNAAFWNMLVYHRAIAFSAKDGKDLVKTLQAKGFQPSTSTLNAFCKAVSRGRGLTPAEMRQLESEWGVQANQDTWEILISSALDDGGLSKAFEIYQESQISQNVRPTLKMVERLMEELCAPTAGKALPDHFQAAMEIYQHMIEDRGHDTAPPENDPQSHKRTARMYSDLLHAAAGSSDDSVFTLLSHMRDRSIRLDSPTILSLISRLMRQSTSHTSAFKIYTRLRELDPSVFDSTTFTAVLSTFSSLVFRPPGRRFPPQDLYFRIIDDMAKSGFPPDEELYVRLFHQYRASIISLNSTVREELGDPNTLLKRDFRRAYTLLRLDPLITPGLNLLNIIMDAFGRFGDFADAYEVWREQLCSPPMYDVRSVCIILDQCGHHDNGPAAMGIWSTVRARESRDPTFVLNRNAWASYVECLCRVGNHNEARRVVMMDLRSPEVRDSTSEGGTPRRPYADRAMLTLLRDLTPKSQRGILAKQIDKYLPHLSNERWS